MKSFFKYLIVLFVHYSFAQGTNINLVSQVNYQTLHQANLNDCWGYTDETGIEYALVGTTKGTSIVSLENPTSPQEIAWFPGSESIWRDLQVYNDYAYVTTEADDGLLIIDLTNLPNSTVLPSTQYFGLAGSSWTSAHDIFIDTLGGWAYICGANRGEGGIIILDIHTNPMQPIEVGQFDTWYCHDAFSQGNLLYGAHISDGLLSVIDVTNRANPVLLGTKTTPSSFTHNVWVTSNDQFAVTTDEVVGAYVALYDVSNPSNIIEMDRIQSSPGNFIIPHNSFIVDDSIIATSYYTDGVVFHNFSRPNNIVEVGAYDTHPSTAGVFDGSWGVYPYFSSGLILASDMSQGLFVLDPNIQAPAYFEGVVKDASNQQVLENVLVEIVNDPQTDLSNANGEFAVGTADFGTKLVRVYKVAYEELLLNVSFQSGVLILDTLELIPIIPVPFNVIVKDAQTNTEIIGANVRLTVPQMEQNGLSDGFGEYLFQVYYQGLNNLTIGKWGYKTKCQDLQIDANTGTITVLLEKGYYDDFEFDFGWSTITDSASSGLWVREQPFYTGNLSSVQNDANFDCGKKCFITGNAQTTNSDIDDVDKGKVTLISPVFDLSATPEAYLYFERFFYSYFGPGLIDDTLSIWLSNGTVSEKIHFVPGNDLDSLWQAVSIKISDIMPLTNAMQLTVFTSDLAPNVNITEAIFDNFQITTTSILETPTFSKENTIIYPNPTHSTLAIQSTMNGEIKVFDLQGKEVFSIEKSQELTIIPIQNLQNGMYFLQLNNFRTSFVKD